MDNKSSKEKSGSSWMNFKKLFKDYGCCGGDRDDLSVSSSDSQKRKMQPKRKKIEKIFIQPLAQPKASVQIEENKSGVSSTQWTEIEEIPTSTDPNVKLTQAYPHRVVNNPGIEIEEYMTQEPIDFEALKHLARSENDMNDEKSAVSALSRKTKKIYKESAKDSYQVSDNNPKSKIKRTPWQPYEDEQVVALVEKYGARWAKIATMLPGRTGKQVRDRYTNKLKPNIKKDEWTKEEEEIFNTLCQQMGHKWSKIASFLPGRTEGQVKNRYYAQFRKKPPKSEANDQTSMTFSDGAPNGEGKKDYIKTDQKESPHNIEIEEPVSYQNIVENELQKYIQEYLGGDKGHSGQVQDLSKNLNKDEIFMSPPHTNDPTNVISYSDLSHNGIQQNHYYNSINNSGTLDKLNTNPILMVTPTKTRERRDEYNKLSLPKERDSNNRLNLFERSSSPRNNSKLNDERDIATMNKCCLNSLEVLDKWEHLSKRMNNIEFLLLNILKDMKEMRFQGKQS